MFEPSGPITEEHFATHVEKFDANRQLLFQEEFEVRVHIAYVSTVSDILKSTV